jgi:Fur family peroxide stress response transcriptional regulator
VKTEKDIMRYDGFVENHHHLYCSDSEEIQDYKNEDLDRLLANYFKKNGIKNFEIGEIKLQINGKFIKTGKQE